MGFWEAPSLELLYHSFPLLEHRETVGLIYRKTLLSNLVMENCGAMKPMGVFRCGTYFEIAWNSSENLQRLKLGIKFWLYYKKRVTHEWFLLLFHPFPTKILLSCPSPCCVLSIHRPETSSTGQVTQPSHQDIMLAVRFQQTTYMSKFDIRSKRGRSRPHQMLISWLYRQGCQTAHHSLSNTSGYFKVHLGAFVSIFVTLKPGACYGDLQTFPAFVPIKTGYLSQEIRRSASGIVATKSVILSQTMIFSQP